MDSNQFWRIIEVTFAPTREEQLELFRRELEDLTPGELIDFARLFAGFKFAAYSWDIWLVPWLFQGGMCSDDGFDDFRSWLISRGRRTYEAALVNADDLVEEIRQVEDPEFELFGYVASKTYRKMSGEDFPNLGLQHPKEPSGGDWLRPTLKDRTGSKMLNRCVVFNEMGDEEFTVIERRFPKIWELCVERGIITRGTKQSPPDVPTPEQIAATIDPNLEKNDFAAYLKAIQDAATNAYKTKDPHQDGRQ
ncbi:MAG TPA: DUF4240 domain-containing protein [Verrucomicrobiae bacterium]|jgi:hypothetical protein|nr:DUF4240 domain-containing protein [Verrucomicrobiae bacterium]